MTRDQFVKYKFRAYMPIDYRHQRIEEPIPCMLLACDFDNNTMTLSSLNPDYEDKEFVTSIDYCFLSKFTVTKSYSQNNEIKHIENG